MRVDPYPRVLHVIASLKVGGTERQLVQFIRRSSSPRSHFVALFDEAGALADQVPNAPFVFGHIKRDPLSVPSNLRSLRALRRLMRDIRVDLVHAHLSLSEVVAALAAPRRLPIVAARRGRNVEFEHRPWLRPVEGLAHYRADLMICNSRYLAEYTRRHDLCPPRIEVIYNAVDLEGFAPAPMPSSKEPTVAVVANMRPWKRHQDFLLAFRTVAAELPAARAVLVGDGAERESLVELAARLGIADRVDFVGEVPDPRPFVAASHVVALTSRHEGFPNALLEGMAMGRPVVATGVGGIPELVRDGVDGFLTPNEPQAIAQRMLDLLRNADVRERMGREARRRAEGFGWDRVVRETEALYREVLRRSSLAPASVHEGAG